MTLSLICTVRNERPTVDGLIASVEEQTLRPDEMIIVDSGSTDGTAEHLHTLGQNRPWLKVLVSEGASIAKGRNIAIEAAQGEIVAMTDAGVRLHPDWLRQITLPLFNDPSVSVAGGWTEMAPETPFERLLADLHRRPDDVNRETFLPSARTLAVRKEVWKKVGGFPEWLTFAGEDTLFLENARSAGYPAKLVPEAIVYWRPRGSLKSYLVQQFRYGRGDGEAALYPTLFLKRFVLLSGIAGIIPGLLFGWPLVLVIGVAFAFFGFYYYVWSKHARGVPLRRLVPLYGLALAGETAQLAGYLRGRVGGGGERIAMVSFAPVIGVPPVVNTGISLAREGFRVDALGIRRKESDPRTVEPVPGFRIRQLALWSRSLLGESDRLESVRYAEFALRAFLWLLFRRVSLVVANDLITLPFAYPAAKLRMKHLIYRAHELWSEQAPDFPRARFWRKLDLFFSRRVGLIVVPEAHRARIYQEEYGASRLPLVVYNCPRLVDKPGSSPLRETLSARGVTAECIVYYQGGIGPTRSIDTLVKSLPHLPGNVALALVGECAPGFEAWMKEFAQEQDLTRRLAYLGVVPYGESLFALAAGADMGVMFLRGDCRNNTLNATASNKGFEYMMMGLPLVGSDSESHREFILGQRIGVCVNPDDPRSIAEGILALARDPSLRKEYGMRARQLAEVTYNWEKVFPPMLQKFRELVH